MYIINTIFVKKKHGSCAKQIKKTDKIVFCHKIKTTPKTDIGDPPTEGSPMVWTGSQWKTSDVKAELDL